MADQIGQILGESMVPNSPMAPVGQALTQPMAQPGPQPTPEMLKDPKFHAIGEWIRKPENMLTALVLAGSLTQDRRPGQSKLDAVAERGLGTLGFRGELRRLNQKDVDEAAAAKSEQDYRKGQIDIGTDRNRIERQGIEAQTQDTLNRETAETGRAGMQDATERWKAQLLADTQLKTARIGAAASSSDAASGFGLSDKDMIDVLKNYNDAMANGVELPPVDAQVQWIMRNKIAANPEYRQLVGFTQFKGKDGKMYVDVKPEYRGLLGIPSDQGATPAPAPKPGTPAPAKGRPQAKSTAPKPKNYDVAKPPTAAIAGEAGAGWKGFVNWRDSQQSAYDEAMKKGLETRK